MWIVYKINKLVLKCGWKYIDIMVASRYVHQFSLSFFFLFHQLHSVTCANTLRNYIYPPVYTIKGSLSRKTRSFNISLSTIKRKLTTINTIARFHCQTRKKFHFSFFFFSNIFSRIRNSFLIRLLLLARLNRFADRFPRKQRMRTGRIIASRGPNKE